MGLRPVASFVIGLLALASICPPSYAQQTTVRGGDPARPSPRMFCWTPDELQNSSRSLNGTETARLSDLPDDARAKITGPLLLKLCIDSTGRVARVLTIRSSGNTAVDNLFADSFAKRRFKPVVKDGAAVPSAMSVSALFHPVP
jgi:outer membrane biosynthesis protein TonB